MQNRKQLVNELKNLLSRKQSREYYAKRLNVTVSEINNMLCEINGTIPLEETSNTKRFNIEKGEIEINGYWKHEPTTEEIVKSHNIDTKEYTLSQYWSKQKSKGFQVSACFKAKKKEAADYVQDSFVDFLATYKPRTEKIEVAKKRNTDSETCLIINIQDLHANKYDIHGNNDIQKRFSELERAIVSIVSDAVHSSSVNKIIYTVGSDLLNSEFTNMTTNGTPQNNIGDYYSSFEAVCDFEVKIIDFLLSSCQEVEILHIPGNHDKYVSWTLIKWLSAFYRNQENIMINTSPINTKYVTFGKNALCFNHGYKIKPEILVQNFATQYKQFSLADHHYVFCGDLHHEHSKNIGNVKFFRLTTTSKAISIWDEDQGYEKTKGEMTAFLIDIEDGMIRTYYEPIKY